MTINKKIANQIKSARLAAGMTQKELSELTGMTQPSLVNIESGQRNITLSTLELIAKALKCTINLSLEQSGTSVKSTKTKISKK